MYAIKSGKLSYMALAMEREQSTCRSLLPRARALLADPEPMLSRLVRGCIVLPFTATVPAVARSHRLAERCRQGRPAQLHGTGVATRAKCVQIALLMVAGAVVADPERMPARMVRGCIFPGLHCYRAR